MIIGTILDLSIKNNELKSADSSKAYIINDRKYENYMDNESWKQFVEEMKTEYKPAFLAYKNGSGDELGIRKVGKYPPKMASYGSSSRMIYLRSRKIPGFCFEKKLPTTIGGVAIMDGYIQKEGTDIYIEAKCREPYSSKSFIMDRKYEDLLRYIDSDDEAALKCYITDIDEKRISVRFVAGEVEITRFDIKQMICHLLGIATAQILHPNDRNIRFIYLLYNPTLIHIADERYKNQIYSIYDTEIKERESIPFAALFKTVLLYLIEKRALSHEAGIIDVDEVVKRFDFRHCDQSSYELY